MAEPMTHARERGAADGIGGVIGSEHAAAAYYYTRMEGFLFGNVRGKKMPCIIPAWRYTRSG